MKHKCALAKGAECGYASVPSITSGGASLHPSWQVSMPNAPARSGGSNSEELPQSLTERVKARVVDARIAVDRREGASRPKSKRRRQSGSTVSDPTAQDLR